MGASCSNTDSVQSPTKGSPGEPPGVRTDRSASGSVDVHQRVQVVSGEGAGQETSWYELLTSIAEEELWPGVRRKEREEWSGYLAQAEEAARKPRKPLPQDVVRYILEGDLGGMDISGIPSIQTKVVVFVSSTFTDTKAERNILMKDVYPYLRLLCRRLGLDFGAVDMRWGVREEDTLEHNTTTMCLDEVDRCVRESAGPAFLCFLSNKYGYRPFPPEIEQEKFEKMLRFLKENTSEVELLQEYFRLDTNSLPPAYVLKPRRADQKDWWDVFEKMQEILRNAAQVLDDPQETSKYYVSVTEREIEQGILNNTARDSQVVLVKRELVSVQAETHKHRHLIDMKGKAIDADAQEHLDKLKHVKVIQNLLGGSILSFNYEAPTFEQCQCYVRDVCDDVARKLVLSILKNYAEDLHVEMDATFQEALQHRSTVLDKAKLFVGREDLLQRIFQYVSSYDKEEGGSLFTVHGESGCGKTALMAMAAKAAKEKHPKAVVVIRFMGTTSRSGSASAVLHSLCTQISRCYGREVSNIPDTYKALIAHLRECMAYATADRPLMLFLDSLDQLSNADFGKNLQWLSLRDKLPKYVRLVVSTLPVECLDILKSFIPTDHLLQVTALQVKDGPVILAKMLAEKHRSLTAEQNQIVLNAFGRCPLPLYLRLAADVAVRWHSYDAIDTSELAPDMPGLISTIFQRLESRYGNTFIQHALGYITASKEGLSAPELEDILSCDDMVLEEVFEFWAPPFRRIPPLLWVRVRNELGMYLVEKGTDGVNAYSWYHRQFWETAATRYLDEASPPFRQTAQEAIVEYFRGKHASGKMYTPTKPRRYDKDMTPKMEDRQVPAQPLVLSGNRTSGRQLNVRQLSEVPHHLVILKAWEEFQEVVAQLEFVEAKFESGRGHECLTELNEASTQSGIVRIQKLARFVGSNLSSLLHEPEAVYQLASQLPPSSAIRQLFDAKTQSTLPMPLLTDLYQKDFEDPCEMTMTGHWSAVRCVQFSPDGRRILSTGEDGTCRIWDAFTGAELVTVSDLPGPTYPDLAYTYEGDRPCTFSKSGEKIILGSEEGEFQVLDLTGALLIQRKGIHSKPVTCVCVSEHDKVLATTSRDGVVKFWDGTSFDLLQEFDLGEPAMFAGFSSDGNRLAVGVKTGLALLSFGSEQWKLDAKTKGPCYSTIACAYAPSGLEVATGGDDSTVTLWDAEGCRVKTQLRGHQGWIWCIKYTKDSAYLLSGSSDRSLRVWDMTTHTSIVRLGGHMSRVIHVALLPSSEEKFATCSLDMAIKVWDTRSVLAGNIPPLGGLHYLMVIGSPCRKYLATVQGWSKQFSFTDMEVGSSSLGQSCDHGNSMRQAAFTLDSKRFITVDTGHAGSHAKDAALAAKAMICSVPGGEAIGTLTSLPAPTAVTTSDKYIALGNYHGELYLHAVEDWETCVCHWNWDQEGCRRDPSDDESWVKHVAMSTSLPHLATTMGKETKVWDISDLSTVHLITELPSNETVIYVVSYSPKGDHLLMGSAAGPIRIFNATTTTYDLLLTLPDHKTFITDMDFTPDGAYMATCARDQTLRIWHIQDGYRLHAVYYGPVTATAFKDEHTVLAGEATGHLKHLRFDTL